MGQQDANFWILKKDSSSRDIGSNMGEIHLGSPKPKVDDNGAKVSSIILLDKGKSLLGSMDPIGSDPIIVSSVDPIRSDPIAASSEPSILVHDPAHADLVNDGPHGKPISQNKVSANMGRGLIEVCLNKGVEVHSSMISSNAPYGDLFFGVPRSDLRITSKLPDVVPPSGFK